jgi:hypothetical protein
MKADLQDVGCVGMEWIELAQDRVSAVMNIRGP